MIKNAPLVLCIALVLGTLMLVNADKKDGFFLVKEEGDIQYRTPGTEEYLALLQDEISLPIGTNIKTSEFSSAHVIFSDNSLLSLDQNTEVSINIAEGDITVQQITGKTWNRVESLTNGNKYSVVNGDVSAKADGTIFGFELFNEKIVSNIEEGKVILANTATSQALEESETGEVMDGAITKASTPEELKKDRWYIRNKLLDVIKRTGLDNIFLKDKLKKELAREDLIETRYTPITDEVKVKVFEFVTSSDNPEICSDLTSIPEYVIYSKYSEIYSQIVSSCEDSTLSSEELDALAEIYSSIKH